MKNIQQKYEILSGVKVGIEFEFFAEMTPKETAKSLSRYISKKVIVPVMVSGLDKKQKGTYHSDIEPTSTLFKLEKDFSGGENMFEMITGPMVYEEGRIIIIKVLQWIKENGYTTSKCAIHLNVSFDEFKLKLRTPLLNLNILKFILSFDEEFIYERFPNRRDSVYAKSIDNFYPINRFVFFDSPEQLDRNDYVLPHEKYFGVNFTKLPKNYLELRYLGGENYERKTFKILEILEYFATKIYSTLQQGDSYTKEEKDKLYVILKAQKKAVTTFSHPEMFLMMYPNITITVDMNGNIEILKAFWTVLREKLFDLVVDSGLRKGHFNLDTDVSMMQLRDGIMKKANDVENMELFDCELSGTISNCDLYRCTIKSSRIKHCKLLEANELKSCKVEFTTIMYGNVLDDCYVNNPTETINGKMIGGVIRAGIIGEQAEISNSTLIVDAEGNGKHIGDKKDVDSLSNAFNSKDSSSYNSAFFKNDKQ